MRTWQIVGYGNGSVERVILSEILCSLVKGLFLLECDIMERDRWCLHLEETLIRVGQAALFPIAEESNFREHHFENLRPLLI